MSDIDQHIAVSQKIKFDDLDWDAARKVGLSRSEADLLTFFADVEGQTVYYFLEVAKLRVARDPELLTFLTLWNYEEYFHSHALNQLLAVCGGTTEAANQRARAVRAGARLKAKIEDAVQVVIARLMPRTFVALWMFWGALQECLTAQAYEQLARITKNPVLAELCHRIAKQERRHFAYYFGQARKKLSGRGWSQRVVRWLATRFYTPVGGGVKTETERAQVVARLFPGDRLFEVMSYIEKRMAQLPGMAGLDCCTQWAARVQPMLPPETRASSAPLPLSVAAECALRIPRTPSPR